MRSIKSGKFEGPLEVLLDLIEKRKLSINEVSLAEITDQYIEYLKTNNFSMEEMAAFAVVASTLMLIKSRSLMPNLELTEEEEQSIEDLENRLKIYRQMRELSLHLNNKFGKNPLFTREPFRGLEAGFIEPKGLSLDGIFGTLRAMIDNFPKFEKLPEVAVKKMITLEEKIMELTERIKNKIELSFSDFSNSKNLNEKKVEIIVSFLAVLELVKQGIVSVNQHSHFQNIDIKKIGN